MLCACVSAARGAVWRWCDQHERSGTQKNVPTAATCGVCIHAHFLAMEEDDADFALNLATPAAFTGFSAPSPAPAKSAAPAAKPKAAAAPPPKAPAASAPAGRPAGTYEARQHSASSNSGHKGGRFDGGGKGSEGYERRAPREPHAEGSAAAAPHSSWSSAPAKPAAPHSERSAQDQQQSQQFPASPGRFDGARPSGARRDGVGKGGDRPGRIPAVFPMARDGESGGQGSGKTLPATGWSGAGSNYGQSGTDSSGVRLSRKGVPLAAPSSGGGTGHGLPRETRALPAAPTGPLSAASAGTGKATLVRASLEDLASAGLSFAATADSFSGLGLDHRIADKLVGEKASAAAPSTGGAIGGGAGGSSAPTFASTAAGGVTRGHSNEGFGLVRPTRVQRLAMPRVLAGHSLLIRSETGSGKTLSFLAPVVHCLLTLHESKGVGPLSRAHGTLALILAPTRELCQQIFTVATRLCQTFPWLVPGIIAGGEKRKSEKARLRKGVGLLVATPGRLVDHLRTTESFNTKSLRFVVMDEADRLLDMGFGAQIREAVDILTRKAAGLPPLFGTPPPGVFGSSFRGNAGGGGANKWGKKRGKQDGEDDEEGSGDSDGASGDEGAGKHANASLGVSKSMYSTVPTPAGPRPWKSLLLSATLSSKVRDLAATVIGEGQSAVLLDASLGAADPGAKPAPLDEEDDEEGGEDEAAALTKAGKGGKVVSNAPAADEKEEEEDEDGCKVRSSTADASAAGGSGDKGKRSASAVAAQALPEGASVPTQLHQYYAVVPIKWRLVSLLAAVVDAARAAREAVAAARRAAAAAGTAPAPAGGKVILFLSTCDAVDLHYQLFSWLLPLMSRGAGKGGKGRGPRKAATSSSMKDDGEDVGSGSEEEHEDAGDAGAEDAAATTAAPRFGGVDFPVYRLHGAIPQAARTVTYRTFAAASCGLLIATDVAARGLDLPAVDLILQADAPSDSQDYVHRIGRTARRGESGRAVLFLQPHEMPYVEVLGAAGLRLTQWDTAPLLSALSRAHTAPVFEVLREYAPPPGYKPPADKAESGGKGKDATAPAPAAAPGPSDANAALLGQFSHLLPAGGRLGGVKRPRDAGSAPKAGGGDEEEGGGGEGEEGGSGENTKEIPGKLLGLANTAASIPRSDHRRCAELNAALWQGILEEAVVRLPNPPPAPGAAPGSAAPAAASSPFPTMMDLARAGFTAFVRSYATHEKATRHIFHPRSLHLGHCAKACGLKEAPTQVVAKAKSTAVRTAAAAAVAAQAAPAASSSSGGAPRKPGVGSTHNKETAGIPPAKRARLEPPPPRPAGSSHSGNSSSGSKKAAAPAPANPLSWSAAAAATAAAATAKPKKVVSEFDA